jgi:hypothetical protein
MEFAKQSHTKCVMWPPVVIEAVGTELPVRRPAGIKVANIDRSFVWPVTLQSPARNLVEISALST